jgi:hypothetical protein
VDAVTGWNCEISVPGPDDPPLVLTESSHNETPYGVARAVA